MSQAHLHLLLNHFPIAGIIIGLIVLSFSMLFRNSDIQKTGMWILLFTALTAIPVFLTGEGAEQILDSIGQKSEFFISNHEDYGEKAFWIIELTGLLSLVALIQQRSGKDVKTLTRFVLLVSIISAILIVLTANSGGKIRHSEIRTTIESSKHNELTK